MSEEERNPLVLQVCELIGDDTIAPIIDSCLESSSELVKWIGEVQGPKARNMADYFLGSLLVEVADAALALGFTFGVNSATLLSSADGKAARRRILRKSGLDKFKSDVHLERYRAATA